MWFPQHDFRSDSYSAQQLGQRSYPIQKITDIHHFVTNLYNFVTNNTKLENSSWNVLYLLWSEVAYIGTGRILP